MFLGEFRELLGGFMELLGGFRELLSWLGELFGRFMVLPDWSRELLGGSRKLLGGFKEVQYSWMGCFIYWNLADIFDLHQ